MRHLLVSLIACAGSALAEPIPVTGDLSLGEAKAPVRVEAYLSLASRHSARFNNEVFPDFKAKYVDTGIANYTLHEFITPPQNLAIEGFLVARCAGADSYFKVIDTLFRRQEEILETGEIGPILLEVAETAGLEQVAAMACVNDRANRDAQAARGRSAKVGGVPTLFVNGTRLADDQMTPAGFDAAIAAAAKARP